LFFSGFFSTITDVDIIESSESYFSYFFAQAKTYPNCYPQTLKAIEDEKSRELFKEKTLDDIVYEVMAGRKCLIVITVTDKDHHAQVLNALGTIKQQIKEKTACVLAISKLYSERADEILGKAGCTEVLRYDISSKAFLYKLKRYLKIYEQGATQDDSDAEPSLDDTSIVIEGANHEEETSETKLKTSAKVDLDDSLLTHSKPTDFQISLIDSIEGNVDFWLFRNKSHAKKYQNTWLVEIIGPSPNVGDWVKVHDTVWQWKTKTGFPLFESNLGIWTFVGKKPEYSWNLNRWAFVSDSPSFNLVKSDQLIASRFRLFDTQTLEITNNSDFAKSIFDSIKETFDFEYVVRSEPSQILWVDQINSKDLTPRDWNIHVGNDDFDWADDSDSIDFKTGADAMRDCNVSGELKGHEIELLEYNLESAIVTLGIDTALAELHEAIEVTVKGENMGLPENIQLKGTVSAKEPEDELGRTIITVTLTADTKNAFVKMQQAVEQRQADIHAFFMKAKGLG
jgi:hypothetical protein